MKYEQHPIGAVIPAPTDEEFANLVESMLSSGFDPSQPIWLYEGKVLDGWSRYLASEKVDVDPEFEQYTGNTPYSFVRSKNVIRRHLTGHQIACIEAMMVDDLARENKTDRANVIKEISERSGLRPKEIASIDLVNKSGSKILRDAVFNGDITPIRAAVLSTKPVSDQEDAVRLASLPPHRRVAEIDESHRSGIRERMNNDANEEEGEEEEATGIRDADGFIVPKKLQDIFASAEWHKQADIALNKIKREAVSLAAHNPHIIIGPIADQLATSSQGIRRATPYVVHQKCHGRGCRECLNCGWLTAEQRSRMSAEE